MAELVYALALGASPARVGSSSLPLPTMEFKYFSKDGAVFPVSDAVIPISNIEYSYGFGVYETIRVTNGVPYFLKDHLERLLSSAQIIDLEHPYSEDFVTRAIQELIQKNQVDTCNLKILLIGGTERERAALYILCLNPLFPDKKLYRDGAHCITYEYERIFPHAKTLNMLGSYIAYRKAKREGAYDAILVDRNGCITEGTRTNFFCIQDKVLISPPSQKILPGVTRKVLEKVASENGYTLEERDISLADAQKYDGAFLTSTSTKILPIQKIDSITIKGPSSPLQELMRQFDMFVEKSAGIL